MALTETERKEWESRFRAEAEADDLRRQARDPSEGRRGSKRVHREEAEREAELALIKQQVREQFWKEKGYVRYKDSRGLESWVSPEEMARREASRQSRRKYAHYEAKWGTNLRQAAMFVGVMVLAVVLGLVLGRN